MNGVFNIMKRHKASWIDVDFRIVWYMLRTAKVVAANIPDQGLSSSR